MILERQCVLYIYIYMYVNILSSMYLGYECVHAVRNLKCDRMKSDVRERFKSWVVDIQKA